MHLQRRRRRRKHHLQTGRAHQSSLLRHLRRLQVQKLGPPQPQLQMGKRQGTKLRLSMLRQLVQPQEQKLQRSPLL